jgi:hypothetical protein
MSSCNAFGGVHPEGKPTNFEFYNQEKAKSEAAAAEAVEAKLGPLSGDELVAMNIKQLKQYISSTGLRHDDCIEKAELRARAEEASGKLGPIP